jgi:hypothetical protein
MLLFFLFFLFLSLGFFVGAIVRVVSFIGTVVTFHFLDVPELSISRVPVCVCVDEGNALGVVVDPSGWFLLSVVDNEVICLGHGFRVVITALCIVVFELLAKSVLARVVTRG